MHKTQSSQSNFKKEKVKRRLIFPNFKTYYKATVIKRVVLVKDMHIDEWKRLRVHK